MEESAKEAGHEVRRISLYDAKNDNRRGFRPKLTQEEHRLQHALGEDMEKRKIAPEIKGYLKEMLWCDTMIFVYPTWWMNAPAAIKGFFDRALVHDIAWSLPLPQADGTPSNTGLIPKLTNITQIVGVSTYGAPHHIVTLAGDNGRRMIANAVRPILSPSATVTWLGLYDMDNTTHDQRTEFLTQVDNLIKNL